MSEQTFLSWLNLMQAKPTKASSRASFPFRQANSQLLNKVYQPEIHISLWSKLAQRWLDIPILVDTGADYTILPKFLAKQVGLDLKKDCQLVSTVGVGGKVDVYFFPRLRVKLGQFERLVPVGFVADDNVPPLLGRHGFLETFVSCFVKNKEIVFSE